MVEMRTLIDMKKVQTPKQAARAPRELKPAEHSAVAGGPRVKNDGGPD